MSLLHHPSADLLLSYAAGRLDEIPAVLTATHLALCPCCRRAVAEAEALAGDLLHTQRPTGVSANALPTVMARLEDVSAPVPPRASDAGDARLPLPLRTYVTADHIDVKWRWRGPGVRYLPVKRDAGGNRLALLEVAPRMAVPHHSHSDRELTMVLAGGYSDEHGSYARGDVQIADSALHHRPVADAEGCLCLIVTRGPLKPTGLIARCVAPFLPI